MKAVLAALQGQVSIEVEGASVKELFERLAEVQEIFGADARCGNCDSQEIRFRVRTVDKFQFHELHCTSCKASLSFGQRKDGGALFPRRRDEEGNPLFCNGWVRWQGNNTAANPAAAADRKEQSTKKAPSDGGSSRQPASEQELARLHAAMKDKESVEAAIDGMYGLLVHNHGEDRALELFNIVLSRHQVEAWQQLSTVGKARLFVSDLWEMSKTAGPATVTQ